MSTANQCNLKTEIFNEALLRAVKNKDTNILNEIQGMEDEEGKISFETVMHEMIRQEAQGIIYEKYCLKYPNNEGEAIKQYDEWCDGPCQDMYNDLWKWIDNACPFAIDDPDCIELFGFCDTNWNKI